MTRQRTVTGTGLNSVKWGLLALPVLLAGCSNIGIKSEPTPAAPAVEEISIDGIPIPTTSDRTKFASRVFGVEGGPRMTKSKRTKKGGGYYKVGKPYTIRGKRYYPKEDPNYSKVGLASWYGPNFHGRLTANGEIYDQYSLSAAHPTMPLPSYAKVTNLENGATVTVRVNDRGPYAHNRIIDLSARAARLLGYTKKGLAKVRVDYVGKARMDGLDEEFLVASYNPGSLGPRLAPELRQDRILLADLNATQNGSQPVRTNLQAFNQSGFAPPVLEFRPLTSNGYDIDFSAHRPQALVNGYLPENSDAQAPAQEIEKILGNGVEFDAPELGISDLHHLVLGPYKRGNRLQQAEVSLLKWGPTSIEFSPDGKEGTLRAIVAKEDLPKILAQFVDPNSTVAKTNDR